MARICEFLLEGWFLVLAAAVLLGVSRRNSLRQMLQRTCREAARGSRLHGHRLQLFAASAFGIAYYLAESLSGMAAGGPPPRSLPDIPQSLLFLLAGSNGVYLTGKVAGMNLFGGDKP